MRWQVQEAKQRLSEVLRAAADEGPQVVTRHGEEVAVVLGIGEYRRLRGQALSIVEYLRHDTGGTPGATTGATPSSPTGATGGG